MSGAERAARVTAATAALGDFRRFEDGSATWGDWAMWAGRLAAALGSVLSVELGPAQLAALGDALADAIDRCEPSGFCADCEKHPAGLCEHHAADLGRCDAYLTLARQLGIWEER